MLQDMFGEDSVPKIFKGEKLYVSVNNVKADIDLSNLVCCVIYKLFMYLKYYLIFILGSEMCRR